jgi:hypothetical protein
LAVLVSRQCVGENRRHPHSADVDGPCGGEHSGVDGSGYDGVRCGGECCGGGDLCDGGGELSDGE